MLNTREHVDFCISVMRNGGTVWLEPGSIVTYLYDTALRFCDVPFYMYRWGDRAEQASLLYLRDKWNLTIDDTFKQRLNQVGKRRRYRRKLDKILIEGMVVADRAFNRLLFMWNDRKPVPTS